MERSPSSQNQWWALRQASMLPRVADNVHMRAGRLLEHELEQQEEPDPRYAFAVEYLGTLSAILAERREAAKMFTERGAQEYPIAGASWLAAARYRMLRQHNPSLPTDSNSLLNPEKPADIDMEWLTEDAMDLVDECMAAGLAEYKAERDQSGYRRNQGF